MRHLDSEDVRGNSLTNATTRSLVAPSPPEPPVTTDPALTNVTGDNYEQRAPLIGQHWPILASDWLLSTHYRLGFIHKYQLCSGAWIRTESTLRYPHLRSVLHSAYNVHSETSIGRSSSSLSFKPPAHRRFLPPSSYWSRHWS